MKKLSIFFELLKQTFAEWNADHAPRLAAALAYYTAFAIAPLLVIAIAIAGAVLGQNQVQSQVVGLISSNVSADAASLVQGMLESAAAPRTGTIAAILGLITLVLGASGAFGQLQGALDVIWDVEGQKRPGGIVATLRTNVLNFGMVIFVGFLLLVSLVLSTVLSSVSTWISSFVGAGFVLQIVNLLVAFGVVTLLFALVYKVLPHTTVAWRDVWIGAAFTSLLFSVGRFALSLYLAQTSTTSAYGAAGSFVVILLWVYYSAQILLFGAEFTQVFSSRFGTRAETGAPSKSERLTADGSIPGERTIVPAGAVTRVPVQASRSSFPAAVLTAVGIAAVMMIVAVLPAKKP
ncbi:MAG TPA: YihY/virulence factor BrkB family protein [Candidatus Limnocylindrales bacterium]|nr:YihY/virulence factor BrkB family protein [Candidatus Limnocylindrales bacterium]